MQRCRVLVINDYATMGGVELFISNRQTCSADCLGSKLNASTTPAFRWNHQASFRAYHTSHDYHLVYYNPALQYFEKKRPVVLPLEVLGTRASPTYRSTAKGLVHDLMTKFYWHAVRGAFPPARIFETILCPGDFMEKALHCRGIMNTRVVFNPSSVPVALQPSSAPGKQRFRIAFVGRISQEKGLAEFIELVQRVNFHRIDVIGVYGDGPDRPAMEQRFTSLIERGKLVFFGRLRQEELFPQMRRFADAVVVPSLGAENAPLVIVEAAMLGMPALVHDGGSMATTGDAVGNKIKFRSRPEKLQAGIGSTRDASGGQGKKVFTRGVFT